MNNSKPNSAPNAQTTERMSKPIVIVRYCGLQSGGGFAPSRALFNVVAGPANLLRSTRTVESLEAEGFEVVEAAANGQGQMADGKFPQPSGSPAAAPVALKTRHGNAGAAVLATSNLGALSNSAVDQRKDGKEIGEAGETPAAHTHELVPGDIIRHIGSRELFSVAKDQTPLPGRDHVAPEEIIYAIDCAGVRVPLFRFTVVRAAVPQPTSEEVAL